MNDIQVFENVFGDDDRKKIIEKVDNCQWMFGHSSLPESYRRFWFSQLRDDPFFAEHLFDKVQFKIGGQCKLRRVFANGQTYGLDGDWHTDSSEKNQYTFVYYVNEDWKENWGGETSFKINGKIISVLPIHNNAVFFRSDIDHYGKAPSRDCYKLRVTIAFHFEVLNWLK